MAICGDQIILGQGLAGSVLGWYLVELGQAVRILDNGHRQAATMIGAGMVNPITGRFLALGWRVEEFLPAMHVFRESVEGYFGKTFYHPRKIVRVLLNETQRETLFKKVKKEAYGKYVGRYYEPGTYGEYLNDPYGSFEILKGGYWDFPLLLGTMREYFRDQGVLIEAEVDYSELEVSDGLVRYGDLEAKGLYCCEGYRVTQNPWFGGENWDHKRGDVLFVNLPKESKLPKDTLFTCGKWLLPTHEGFYKMGAHYDTVTFPELPSEEAHRAITEGVQVMFKAPLEVEHLSSHAGVRPILSNHRPLVKSHDAYPHVRLFNGFGSKGGLYVPFHAMEEVKRYG